MEVSRHFLSFSLQVSWLSHRSKNYTGTVQGVSHPILSILWLDDQQREHHMLITTQHTFDHTSLRLYPSGKDRVTLSSRIRDFIKRLFQKKDMSASIQEKLKHGDRRKPAYMQLRTAWDSLDEISQKEALGWLLQKTMTDPLSGLETLIAKEVSGKKPAGWVDAISDLNSLKAINDTWGHETGDTILSELGHIVNFHVQLEGGRAFRVGGDEISYWFPNKKKAKQALQAIDTTLQITTFTIGGRKHRGFSISYGIGRDASSADRELYRDKERRKELGQRANHDQIPSSIEQVVTHARFHI